VLIRYALVVVVIFVIVAVNHADWDPIFPHGVGGLRASVRAFVWVVQYGLEKHFWRGKYLLPKYLPRFFALKVLGLLFRPAPSPSVPQGPPQVLEGARAIPSPLFWADGLTRADELEAYQATGFNTVVVRLFWQPSPDGSLNPET
jgi:hypothetical protein